MGRLSLLALAVVGAVGCGADPAPRPAAPTIHVREAIGAGVGPVGGGRGREYDGPVDHAPDWARPRPPATNK